MIHDAATLPVVETFHSLQGEGHHSGRSAFFIRLAGCNVGCPWCDTKHSWPKAAHPQRHLDDLAQEAAAAERQGAAFTVITGGEPLHHNLDALASALRESSSNALHLETSGADPLSGSPDWITLSPKPHRPPRQELLSQCDELKVVIHGQTDLDFAQAMAAAVRPSTQLLLQPGWGSDQGQQLAVEHAQRNPRWRLSLQTHKWIGVR
jgi:7-carboxy-7-deazaguanine synthase